MNVWVFFLRFGISNFLKGLTRFSSSVAFGSGSVELLTNILNRPDADWKCMFEFFLLQILNFLDGLTRVSSSVKSGSGSGMNLNPDPQLWLGDLRVLCRDVALPHQRCYSSCQRYSRELKGKVKDIPLFYRSLSLSLYSLSLFSLLLFLFKQVIFNLKLTIFGKEGLCQELA